MAQITPEQFLRALADDTRLRIVKLLSENDELCVCELTEALDMVQPKISRHLAILRKGGVLLDRRQGLWIHYRIHPELPDWASRSLAAIIDGCHGRKPYSDDRRRLTKVARQSAASCSA